MSQLTQAERNKRLATLIGYGASECNILAIIQRFKDRGVLSTPVLMMYLMKVLPRIYADPIYKSECDEVGISPKQFFIGVLKEVQHRILSQKNDRIILDLKKMIKQVGGA